MTGKPLGMAKKAIGAGKDMVKKAMAPGQMKKAAGSMKGSAKAFAPGIKRKGIM